MKRAVVTLGSNTPVIEDVPEAEAAAFNAQRLQDEADLQAAIDAAPSWETFQLLLLGSPEWARVYNDAPKHLSDVLSGLMFGVGAADDKTAAYTQIKAVWDFIILATSPTQAEIDAINVICAASNMEFHLGAGGAMVLGAL